MDTSNVAEVVARGGNDAVIGPAMEAVPLAMVLTDPRLDDNPITYVNTAFETITLYSRAFAVGRNCRFLQGEKTDPEKVRPISDAIAAGEDISLDIVNYKADGSPFMNRLMISAVRDDDGEIIAQVGIQKELRARAAGRAGRADLPAGQAAGGHDAGRGPAPGEEPPRHAGRADPDAGQEGDHAPELRGAKPPRAWPRAAL
jgi:PAS domain S-box-containing protein